MSSGFGQLHPRSQGITTLGTIYSSSVFENRAPKGQHLVLNFIGGATNRGIVDQPHEELVSQVIILLPATCSLEETDNGGRQRQWRESRLVLLTTRQDHSFQRLLNEKPDIVLGCPGILLPISSCSHSCLVHRTTLTEDRPKKCLCCSSHESHLLLWAHRRGLSPFYRVSMCASSWYPRAEPQLLHVPACTASISLNIWLLTFICCAPHLGCSRSDVHADLSSHCKQSSPDQGVEHTNPCRQMIVSNFVGH